MQVVKCNDGLHFNAMLTVPSKSRLKVTVVDHFKARARKYRKCIGLQRRLIDRIDIRPVTENTEEYLMNYVQKTIKNRRIDYDDAILILPRVGA